LLLLSFAVFALLTHVVPFYLILMLVAAMLLGGMLHLLIGAIAGFSLEETKQKIGALNVIWTAQRPAGGCALVVVALVYSVVSWVASLWVFWRRPIGDPSVAGWIALYQFFLPQFIFTPLMIAANWPTVTSEFIDDDLRNSYLTTSFSRIIYSTVCLVYPVWLFQDQFGFVLGRWLPPFWFVEPSCPALARRQLHNL
jgi:hypothetical protein